MKQEGATLQRRNGYGPQRTRMALPWGTQKSAGCQLAASGKPDELVNTPFSCGVGFHEGSLPLLAVHRQENTAKQETC